MTAELDPHSVRVTLAPSAATAGLDPIVVDPDSGRAADLRRIDAEHAVLLDRTPARPVGILLLPGEPAGTGRGVTRREVIVEGWRIELDVESAARAALRDRARRGRSGAGPSGPVEVRAIIPGVVLTVSVVSGDSVTAGQQLVVVEAMKMQNELNAARDGTIERVAVAPGQTIEVGDLLLVLT